MQDSFRNNLSSKFLLWREKRQENLNNNETTECNTDIIPTPVLFPLKQDVKLNNIFHCELVPLLTFLFESNAETNYPHPEKKRKIHSVEFLKVDHSSRLSIPNFYIIDDGSLIYNVHWLAEFIY